MFNLFIIPYINIFGFKLYYYGIVYALGFLATYIYFRYQSKSKRLDLTLDQIDTLMIYIIIGGIIGGRLGEFIFFQPDVLLSNPLQVLMIRNGGMSIHGGILGVLGSIWLFRRKQHSSVLNVKQGSKKHKKISTYEITDNAVMIAAFTLFFGRIANFVNAELCGRASTLPWAVNLHNPPLCDGFRHPSQLYEAVKNLIIGFTLMFVESVEIKTNKYKTGFKTWLFVLMYGILRTVTNFWRDDVLWFFGILSTGQVLSLLMTIIAGFILVKYYLRPFQTKARAKPTK
jgi:phosphatidylglycerol:prolipoprotein diacylglycerol transferase